MRYRSSVLAAIVLGAVTGCTSVPVAVCSAVVDYSPGQQAEAAEEVITLPPGSIVVQMLLDYGELRDRLRACQ